MFWVLILLNIWTILKLKKRPLRWFVEAVLISYNLLLAFVMVAWWQMTLLCTEHKYTWFEHIRTTYLYLYKPAGFRYPKIMRRRCRIEIGAGIQKAIKRTWRSLKCSGTEVWLPWCMRKRTDGCRLSWWCVLWRRNPRRCFPDYWFPHCEWQGAERFAGYWKVISFSKEDKLAGTYWFRKTL